MGRRKCIGFPGSIRRISKAVAATRSLPRHRYARSELVEGDSRRGIALILLTVDTGIFRRSGIK